MTTQHADTIRAAKVRYDDLRLNEPERVRAAIAALKAASRASIEAAREDLHAAIRAAYADDVTVTAIGRAMGVTYRNTIYSIIQDTTPTTDTAPDPTATWTREGDTVTLNGFECSAAPDGFTGTLTFDVDERTGHLTVPSNAPGHLFGLYAQVARVVNEGR